MLSHLHTHARVRRRRRLSCISTVARGPCGEKRCHLWLLSVPPSVPPPPTPLSLSSLPVLTLSSLHLSPSFSLSLPFCSSTALHQIEADSCHQAYFRHWHTRTHACTHTSRASPSVVSFRTPPLSVFVTFSRNFSILLSDSI